ncbi:MAG: ribbon-helix-helix protein, CopG family [Planctomycetes bacterium]|nr:ribbon-helix-helix protein, CopG family [Planctomycetota bacterium]
MTYMIKTQVYLSFEDLARLKKIAKRMKRSLADLVREAVQKTWLREIPKGPVGLWKKPASKNSNEHDSIYDEP